MKLDGATFYLVGGSVRDRLLGRPPKDNDYVVLTQMSFDEFAAALEAAGATIFVRKPEFLTLRLKFQGEVADVAFPRIDGTYTAVVEYTDPRDNGRREYWFSYASLGCPACRDSVDMCRCERL